MAPRLRSVRSQRYLLHEVGAVGDISKHSALIASTAHKFAPGLGMEEDDLRQDLTIKALRAMELYDAARRHPRGEHGFVYQALANYLKDLYRDRIRRQNGKLETVHIEDTDVLESWRIRQDAEEVYRVVEDGSFSMPEDVTEGEREVIYLLVIGHTGVEIAGLLGVEYASIEATMRVLRVKFAALRPARPLVAAA